MNIEQKSVNGEGSFYIRDGEKVLAEMTYVVRPANALMIIKHTDVDEVLKGQKIGYQLLDKAVEYARGESLKIQPLCSFANAVMHKNLDKYGDLLGTGK